MNVHPIGADIIAIMHVAFVAFVLGGFIVILAGGIFAARISRNWWLRGAHLLAVSYLLMRCWFGMACPLTDLEQRLRGTATAGDPIAIWSHPLFFKGADHRQFVWAVTAFAAMVFLETICTAGFDARQRAERR